MEVTPVEGSGPVFLCGALALQSVLRQLTGDEAPGVAAVLSGWQLVYPEDAAVPLVAQGAGSSPGRLLEVAPAALPAVAEVLGLSAWPVEVMAESVAVTARLYARPVAAPVTLGASPPPGGEGMGEGGPANDPTAWQATFAPLIAETCAEILRLTPQVPPATMAARLPQMLVGAAGRLRAAAAPSPAALRRAPGTVEVTTLDLPYARFFAVEEYHLRHARFDGSLGPQVLRSVFTSGDAVTVLPYDSVRDRVLLVDQFRMGPLSRGDRNPWQLEAVAGRIDPGETPEQAGRREAVEEAGLTLGALLPVADYYTTTGAVSEYLYSYVGLCDLPDGAAGVFGVEAEAEDIRGHIVPFDALMGLVASGEIANAPLLITALWLQRERPRLRKAG